MSDTKTPYEQMLENVAATPQAPPLFVSLTPGDEPTAEELKAYEERLAKMRAELQAGGEG